MKNKIKKILSILIAGIMLGAIPAVAVGATSPVYWDGEMGTHLDSNDVRVLDSPDDCSGGLAPGQMLWIFSPVGTPVGTTLSNVELHLSGTLTGTSTPIFDNGNTFKFKTSYTPNLAGLTAWVTFDGTDTQNTKLKISHGCTRQEIPEFPTVALPIAAVIGLVVFFQYRQKKEE